jgi:tRNA(Arg) A34 adenosine deaminase TadA
MLRMLERAIGLSFTGSEERKYKFGAICQRSDGAIVAATNGGVAGSRTPSAHAESRVSRKADVGSVVYVARTLRGIPRLALARPCKGCQLAMKHRGVSKCYYTINDAEYGCLYF